MTLDEGTGLRLVIGDMGASIVLNSMVRTRKYQHHSPPPQIQKQEGTVGLFRIKYTKIKWIIYYTVRNCR